MCPRCAPGGRDTTRMGRIPTPAAEFTLAPVCPGDAGPAPEVARLLLIRALPPDRRRPARSDLLHRFHRWLLRPLPAADVPPVTSTYKPRNEPSTDTHAYIDQARLPDTRLKLK